MTDIAALIERLNSAGIYLGNTIAGYRDDDFKRSAKGMVDVVRAMQDAADALSRLATPPEIAGLIERWEKRIAWTAKWEIDDRLDNDTLAALRALAQENERLQATDWSDIGAVSILKERIRELEAERNELDEEWHRVVHERDAIRRKTIEECVKAVERIDFYWPKKKEILEAIRALAHSESEGKEERQEHPMWAHDVVGEPPHLAKTDENNGPSKPSTKP